MNDLKTYEKYCLNTLPSRHLPALKVNKRNTKTGYEVCSKITTKKPERGIA